MLRQFYIMHTCGGALTSSGVMHFEEFRNKHVVPDMWSCCKLEKATQALDHPGGLLALCCGHATVQEEGPCNWKLLTSITIIILNVLSSALACNTIIAS